jgi:hypothetical protein
MAGNEQLVVDFLINNKNSLTLNHLGIIKRIQNPGANGQLIDITSTNLLRTEDAGKKADIFINGKGVSIKQTGSSFLYNRLQRAEMLKVFTSLGFLNPSKTLSKMDSLIQKFQNGEFESRDRHWSEGFNEPDFVSLLEFLMMKGSPNLGVSAHPADFVLTAPKTNIAPQKISCDSFNEYFTKYKDVIYLSLRRQWVGQSSNSEHTRATGLSNKPDNGPWIFKEIKGSPRTGWKTETEFPIKGRRTVYMIFLTVKP